MQYSQIVRDLVQQRLQAGDTALQHELKAAHAKYFELYEFAPVGYCSLNNTGVVVDSNLTLALLLGVARDALIGTSLSRFLGPQFIDNYHQWLRGLKQPLVTSGTSEPEPKSVPRDVVDDDAAALRESFFGVFQLHLPHGTELWVQITAAAFAPQDDQLLHLVVTDITANRQRAAELRQLELRLLAKQRLECLGTMAGGVAHDFNNILTAIIGNISLAGSEVGISTTSQGFLDTATQSAVRAAAICRQMLDYAGGGHGRLQEHNLNQLVRETASMLNPLRPRIEWALVDAQLWVRVNASQIHQICLNLCVNAMEAMSATAGDIKIATEIVRLPSNREQTATQRPLAAGTYAALRVTDFGCGMSLDTQERMFDPFFTTKTTGRGLGLSSVLGIVRGYQGNIEVQSQLGRGTVITVLLPCTVGESAAPGFTPTQPQVRKECSSGRPCVLLVDDEETILNMLAIVLAQWGYNVITATNGLEAVTAYREAPSRFDLVLMDITMPILDGVQALQAMTAIKPPRCLLMTGFDADATRLRCAQPLDILHKPFVLDELHTRIQSLLAP